MSAGSHGRGGEHLPLSDERGRNTSSTPTAATDGANARSCASACARVVAIVGEDVFGSNRHFSSYPHDARATLLALTEAGEAAVALRRQNLVREVLSADCGAATRP